MSQKQQKPTLSGQRIKTRKRDEKEKYDPGTFAEQIISGLNEAKGDLEQASKFLVASGSKLNYRTYAETLLDILIAGGMLAPGGTIFNEGGDNTTSSICIFKSENGLEGIKATVQLFSRLIRQYKYLEKSLDEELKKVLLFLKGFTDEQRKCLAQAIAVFLNTGLTSAGVLSGLIHDHLVKEGLGLDFANTFFNTWLRDLEKDTNSLISILKKAEIDGKLLQLFPANKRSEEAFEAYFNKAGLKEIVDFQRNQYNIIMRRELKEKLKNMMEHDSTPKEISQTCKEYKDRHNLQEFEICLQLWKTVMASVEWNKKEELVADQALKHLKSYASVFAEFTTSGKSELILIQRVQDYCYDNMNFMKVFQKIIMLFYKVDVLSEDSIIKWYKDSHTTKGKSVFLPQMAKMVEWLENAEEESSEDEE
ncbi:eIF5-mimic protein 2-like [Rhopilema esculentum]|uniref:eIF5-mimic protein 2-like n=1 Tax=Rhopilema esculentum TaxID=499914 RepID=UPI0031D3226D